MRTREEIRSKYYKDCSIKEGWLVTTDEEYLLEEIFEAQNQAKNNEVFDIVMLSAYVVVADGTERIVMAQNIAHACDKMEELGIKHYEFVYAKSLETIH